MAGPGIGGSDDERGEIGRSDDRHERPIARLSLTPLAVSAWNRLSALKAYKPPAD